MTYHDLPTAVFFGGAKSKGQNQYVEVVGSSSSVPLGRNGFDFRCLFELLVHLNPLQQGALRTGDSQDAPSKPMEAKVSNADIETHPSLPVAAK